jgi:hypothetical protein
MDIWRRPLGCCVALWQVESGRNGWARLRADSLWLESGESFTAWVLRVLHRLAWWQIAIFLELKKLFAAWALRVLCTFAWQRIAHSFHPLSCLGIREKGRQGSKDPNARERHEMAAFHWTGSIACATLRHISVT